MIKTEIRGKTFKTNLYNYLELLNYDMAQGIDADIKKLLLGIETNIHGDHGVSIDIEHLDKSIKDKVWECAADFLDPVNVKGEGNG